MSPENAANAGHARDFGASDRVSRKQDMSDGNRSMFCFLYMDGKWFGRGDELLFV